ncbi:MAG: hypothetical protein DCE90_13985 [Pseudanabaena sp.]|nr:MAG: hypothetical protein DCE90_13985 [Pseudanabaena sp.]
MLPNTTTKNPLDFADCIEQEKYVIVLKIEVINQFANTWHFLSKKPRITSTVKQDHIKIFDDKDDADFLLLRLVNLFGFSDAFIHPVTVQSCISIWGNWSIPSSVVSED